MGLTRPLNTRAVSPLWPKSLTINYNLDLLRTQSPTTLTANSTTQKEQRINIKERLPVALSKLHDTTIVLGG